MTVRINTDLIDSWTDFHQVFKIALGFPDYYGANMNAWIDCMTYIDDPDAGMTRNAVKPGQTIIIELVNSDNFKEKHEDIYYALLDCSAIVNSRKIDDKTRTFIAIARL
jgi:hypothetical protein